MVGEPHKLYVVATPIGNLEDITLRALRVLKEVKLIAAEDTRKAQVLLNHYDIKTPVTSFFEANEYRKTPVILNALEQGDVALISEAGMPGISDPGYPLITAAIEQGISVVPIPGPSAHTAALVVSGLPTDRFLFVGFLPRKHAEPALQDLAPVTSTMVFYEAPHRLRATLEAMHAILGNRRLALCRELTKLHEEIWRGDLAQALVWLDAHDPRGEYTLVVAGASEEELKWSEPRVRQALLDYMARGLSRSQAAREVASLSGWSRRKVYDLPVDRDQAHIEKP
ncbi:MAG: 16S rRNA (cytidine(1402)-2'-O)-methyltransferase [Anaerolineae bacterium]